MAKVAVLLAPGFEEIEAITPIDLLRRAGNDVFSVGVESLSVTGAHNIEVSADLNIADLNDYTWDCVIIPGGMPGATNIAKSKEAVAFVRHMFDQDKFCAAICAAPAYVFSKAGILKEKNYTCFPGCEEVSVNAGGHFNEGRVVIDSNLITSRAPGTAIEFSLALIERLNGVDAAQKIADAVLFNR